MSENSTNITAAKAVQKIKLSALKEPDDSGKSVLSDSLDIIKDIKVRVSVSVGQTELTVQSLFELTEGQILSLDKQTSEPVDVIVDGHVVARGTLVAVDDSFGVRITEVPERP